MKGRSRDGMLALGLGLFLAQAAAGAGGASVQALQLGDAILLATQKMQSVDGSRVSIADVRGEKGTLVVFTCNACPWAKAWEERIAALGNLYRGKGIGVIAINANDPARNAEDGYDVMQTRARERGMRFPYVVDATSEMARRFGATRTPEAFLFDSGGRLVYHGTIDDNAHDPGKVQKRYLRDALDAVVTGRPVPVPETKALGCSIKFRPAS
ncbi:MAG: thioredoxin family protein [Acidobacteriota bacterium]